MLITLTICAEIFSAGACLKLVCCLYKNCLFKTSPAPLAIKLQKKKSFLCFLKEQANKLQISNFFSETPVRLCCVWLGWDELLCCSSTHPSWTLHPLHACALPHTALLIVSHPRNDTACWGETHKLSTRVRRDKKTLYMCLTMKGFRKGQQWHTAIILFGWPPPAVHKAATLCPWTTSKPGLFQDIGLMWVVVLILCLRRRDVSCLLLHFCCCPHNHLPSLVFFS